MAKNVVNDKSRAEAVKHELQLSLSGLCEVVVKLTNIFFFHQILIIFRNNEYTVLFTG